MSSKLRRKCLVKYAVSPMPPPLANGVCGNVIGFSISDGPNQIFDARFGNMLYNQCFKGDCARQDIWISVGQRFYTTNHSLRPWLDPLGTGAISIDGYHPTGIEPHPVIERNRFSLYPNPVSHILHISSGNSQGGLNRFQVLDISGTRQLSGSLNGDGSGSIDTTPLSPGIYLIRFENGDYPEIHKFIVTR